MTPGKPGVPGRNGRQGVKGVPGKPGYFKMYFKNLRSGIVEDILMPKGFASQFGPRYYRFSINEEQMHVDLDKGHIMINPETEDVVQNVTLAFVTSMLYLMVCIFFPNFDCIHSYQRIVSKKFFAVLQF